MLSSFGLFGLPDEQRNQFRNLSNLYDQQVTQEYKNKTKIAYVAGFAFASIIYYVEFSKLPTDHPAQSWDFKSRLPMALTMCSAVFKYAEYFTALVPTLVPTLEHARTAKVFQMISNASAIASLTMLILLTL